MADGTEPSKAGVRTLPGMDRPRQMAGRQTPQTSRDGAINQGSPWFAQRPSVLQGSHGHRTKESVRHPRYSAAPIGTQLPRAGLLDKSVPRRGFRERDTRSAGTSVPETCPGPAKGSVPRPAGQRPTTTRQVRPLAPVEYRPVSWSRGFRFAGQTRAGQMAPQIQTIKNRPIAGFVVRCGPLFNGAVEKTRTSTGFTPQRPQRCASTNSATTAH